MFALEGKTLRREWVWKIHSDCQYSYSATQHPSFFPAPHFCSSGLNIFQQLSDFGYWGEAKEKEEKNWCCIISVTSFLLLSFYSSVWKKTQQLKQVQSKLLKNQYQLCIGLWEKNEFISHVPRNTWDSLAAILYLLISSRSIKRSFEWSLVWCTFEVTPQRIYFSYRKQSGNEGISPAEHLIVEKWAGKFRHISFLQTGSSVYVCCLPKAI